MCNCCQDHCNLAKCLLVSLTLYAKIGQDPISRSFFMANWSNVNWRKLQGQLQGCKNVTKMVIRTFLSSCRIILMDILYMILKNRLFIVLFLCNLGFLPLFGALKTIQMGQICYFCRVGYNVVKCTQGSNELACHVWLRYNFLLPSYG